MFMDDNVQQTKNDNIPYLRHAVSCCVWKIRYQPKGPPTKPLYWPKLSGY